MAKDISSDKEYSQKNNHRVLDSVILNHRNLDTFDETCSENS